jgi:hypothetical protein
MVRPDYCAVDHLQTGVATAAVIEGFKHKLPQARERQAPKLAVNRWPFAEMLVQIAPSNARPCNPEYPIQNKAMISRTPPTARTALDHERLKTGQFLVTHQTPDHGNFLKSYLESETTRVGNPLCQHVLTWAMQFFDTIRLVFTSLQITIIFMKFLSSINEFSYSTLPTLPNFLLSKTRILIIFDSPFMNSAKNILS